MAILKFTKNDTKNISRKKIVYEIDLQNCNPYEILGLYSDEVLSSHFETLYYIYL